MMNIMAFSDVHGDMRLVRKLVKRAQKKDIGLVVCAGDFTVFENQMKSILKQFNSIGKKVILVPGNHESPFVVQKHVKKLKNVIHIHKKLLRVHGVTFCGWGTDGFTRRSAEMRDAVREWRKQLKKEDRTIVIVTHAPPFKTKLDKIDREHVGNADIRKAIERIKPLLAISGHIHENEGKKDKIGKTLCVNPGWKGMVLKV
jgi:uncharacterized protein